MLRVREPRIPATYDINHITLIWYFTVLLRLFVLRTGDGLLPACPPNHPRWLKPTSRGRRGEFYQYTYRTVPTHIVGVGTDGIVVDCDLHLFRPGYTECGSGSRRAMK